MIGVIFIDLCDESWGIRLEMVQRKKVSCGYDLLDFALFIWIFGPPWMPSNGSVQVTCTLER